MSSLEKQVMKRFVLVPDDDDEDSFEQEWEFENVSGTNSDQLIKQLYISLASKGAGNITPTTNPRIDRFFDSKRCDHERARKENYFETKWQTNQ